MEKSLENQALLDAVERNTHAVRALGEFFLGYFYQKLISFVVSAVGLVLLSIDPYTFSWATFLLVAGPLLLLIFVFLSIADALWELKASRKPLSSKS